MRIIVVILAALAGLKIYTQDQIYRTATTEALIKAYRESAITACRNSPTATPTAAFAQLWSSASQIELRIGRDDVDVSLWQFEDDRWRSTYKQPYLVLTPAQPGANVACTYDITAGAARISSRS